MGMVLKESSGREPESHPLRGLGRQTAENSISDAIFVEPLAHFKDDSKEQRTKDRKRKWKTVWYNFSQETTLHGLNKTTEESPFTIRR